MKYFHKYLKYKQKYLSLLEKMNGGMTNWDKNNNLLLWEENKKLNKIIELQNDLLKYNPILKSNYKNDNTIISKIEDYNIHPTTQVDYLTKKIEEGEKYNKNIHIKRQYL